MTAPTELYRHWGFDGELLYVGISQSAFRRLEQHLARAEWATRIAKITVEVHPSRGAAIDAEELAILKEQPLFNKAGRRARVSHVYDAAEEIAKFDRMFPAIPA